MRVSLLFIYFFCNEPYHRYGYNVSVNLALIYRTFIPCELLYYILFFILFCHFLCLRIARKLIPLLSFVSIVYVLVLNKLLLLLLFNKRYFDVLLHFETVCCQIFPAAPVSCLSEPECCFFLDGFLPCA